MTALAYVEDLGDRLIVVNANVGKRNALTPEYYTVLTDALDLARTEPRITSVILRGDGGFFCAGGDLNMLASRRALSRPDRLRKIEDLHDIIRAIMDCPKPVVAAVEGGAAGAGVSLAFACDMVVAEQKATFTVAYVKAGLVPDGGITSTLTAHLPRALVMRMALLGEQVSAERLYELGALTQIAPAGAVLQATSALCDQIALGPSATHGAIKQLINAAQTTTMRDQMDAERDAMADAVVAPEAVEGIDAFLAKRSPAFDRLRGQS